MSELQLWAWLFLAVYILIMLLIGVLSRKNVRGADDYATARGGYGPFFLALAFAATSASGATFIGLPGLAYDLGISLMWYALLYPIGIYLGVFLCLRLVTLSGNSFGSRSIPDYLGDRYQSDAMRIISALFSLLLLFYLGGQLVAGLVMFELILGVDPDWALGITAGVLLCYVSLGGAHADILTDGLQGLLMIAIAAVIFFMFVVGFGTGGGIGAVLERLGKLDTATLDVLHPRVGLVGSVWALVAIVIAHIPLGMLPHVGNKLWALKNPAQRYRFLGMAAVFGFLLPLVACGGLLARAVLGDDLFADGHTPNEAIPALFIELMPAWVAALLSVTILSAIMSTADGLLISSSQVFANDIYRKTLVPHMRGAPSPDGVDRRALAISRWATAMVLLGSAALAQAQNEMNVALLVWIGVGGMSSSLAGPLVLGALWRGVTRRGALAGLITGAVLFVLAHTGYLGSLGWQYVGLPDVADWLRLQAPNPPACAAIASIVSAIVTWVVSLLTEPLPPEHLARLFGTDVPQPAGDVRLPEPPASRDG